jgi:hypothetical protein
MRLRVVCGLGETMATFWPTRVLTSVDLPAFGRPTIATNPDLKGMDYQIVRLRSAARKMDGAGARRGGRSQKIQRRRRRGKAEDTETARIYRGAAESAQRGRRQNYDGEIIWTARISLRVDELAKNNSRARLLRFEFLTSRLIVIDFIPPRFIAASLAAVFSRSTP